MIAGNDFRSIFFQMRTNGTISSSNLMSVDIWNRGKLGKKRGSMASLALVSRSTPIARPVQGIDGVRLVESLCYTCRLTQILFSGLEKHPRSEMYRAHEPFTWLQSPDIFEALRVSKLDRDIKARECRISLYENITSD